MAIQSNNIFKYALGPKYKIGVLGASECPVGYIPIQSLSGCNKARNELSISGWSKENYNNHRHRLPYCWIGSGGGANYNSNGDWGPNGPAPVSKLICEYFRK